MVTDAAANELRQHENFITFFPIFSGCIADAALGNAGFTQRPLITQYVRMEILACAFESTLRPFSMHDAHPELHVILTHIVKLLVDHPDQAVVIPMVNQEPPTFQIRVHESDLGQVIGKQGRTARAIRTILAAYSMRAGPKVAIDIVGLSVGKPN